MKRSDNRPGAAAPSADTTGSSQADSLRLSPVQAGQALRRRAGDILLGKAGQSPENIEALSHEETRQMLHELRVHQIELEIQNEELRRAQAELDAARARYFDLYDLAPVGYCTVSEKGLILEANLTAATLLGVEKGALVKQPLTRFILRGDLDSYYHHRKLLFETGAPQVCEFRMLRVGAAPFWAQMETTMTQHGEGLHVYRAVLSDITKRKQTEEALLESKEKFSKAFQTSPNAVTITRPEDGKFVEVNDTFISMTGFTREESFASGSIGLKLWVNEDDRQLVMADLQAGRAVMGKEFQFRTKSGAVITGLFSAQMIELSRGLCILSSINDISERKRVEEERAKLEAQNRQLQKAESLGRMAGAIVHHFNNMLQAIMGNIQMAMRIMPQNTGPVKNLTAAMEVAHTAEAISSQMLTYLGQSFDKHESLNLSEVCRWSLPMLQAIIPENVKLETDLPSPGPVISANVNQIQQIMTILVTNAWEATRESPGSIHLSVKTVSQADISASYRYPVDWQPQDNVYACMEVTDESGGIENKDMEKIFDPFFSTKFTGRGMGLAVVLGIVRAHGGVVTVESAAGRGSIFRAYFPVYAEGADKATSDPERRRAQGAAGRRREDGA